ncbi:hypothetical protein C8R44DRAFT_821775 [Mycena epipterygia]|nr:hypothetical protein C8R44DRAFT_821775 [Mycena epipterygia]
MPSDTSRESRSAAASDSTQNSREFDLDKKFRPCRATPRATVRKCAGPAHTFGSNFTSLPILNTDNTGSSSPRPLAIPAPTQRRESTPACPLSRRERTSHLSSRVMVPHYKIPAPTLRRTIGPGSPRTHPAAAHAHKNSATHEVIQTPRLWEAHVHRTRSDGEEGLCCVVIPCPLTVTRRARRLEAALKLLVDWSRSTYAYTYVSVRGPLCASKMGVNRGFRSYSLPHRRYRTRSCTAENRSGGKRR